MRYLKVSLLLGSLTALVVSGLIELGAFQKLDLGLGNFLELRTAPESLKLVQHICSVLIAFAIAWTTVDIPRPWMKGLVAAVTLAQLLSAVWVLNLFDIFFSPFPSALAVILSFSTGLLYARSEGGSRKRVVRAIFGERISQKTYSALVNTNTPLLLGGDRSEATILVCEIFNHDQLAEALPVADYVSLNNAFLRNASEFLVESGAYLDECDGESLRVVFGTPVADPRHAETACRAALALAERLDEVNRECRRVWGQAFDYRLGINSGEIIVAAYGSRRLGAFSVAGEPVEFARRLCAINSFYGSRILVGTASFQMAEGAVEVRPIDLIQRHPEDRHREEIYELLAVGNALSDEQLERRDLYWKGVVYYREQRWDEALAHFQMALVPEESDGPLEFYLRRVEQVRSGLPVLEWGARTI